MESKTSGKIAALVLAKAKPRGEEEEEEDYSDTALSDAYEEFAAAQRAGDSEGGMAALRSFVRLCSE